MKALYQSAAGPGNMELTKGVGADLILDTSG